MAAHRAPRRSRAGSVLTTRLTVLTAAAGAAAALTGGPAGAEPVQERAGTAGARVDRLHHQAEVATEKYNSASEKAGALRERIEETQDERARTQARVNRMRAVLSSVATEQYRSGGMDPAFALLLSSDPDDYLDRADTLYRAGSSQDRTLRRLQGAQRSLDRQKAEADRDLRRLAEQTGALKRHKRTIQARLAEARRVLEGMTGGERAAHDRGARDGLRDTLHGGVPGVAEAVQAGMREATSARAAAAVAAARSKLGSPYVWGATGPSSFDCSGLMVWAYRQAGVALPRTSQGQRDAGRRVPLSQARPGDLVTYRGDASHVAMYVGGGQVIHAPKPGASVRYDPVGMLPVTAVTRP